MRLNQTTLCILGALLCATGRAQHTAPISVDAPRARDTAATINSPAQSRIAAAKQELAADPRKVSAWNELATALIALARETSDAKYLNDAESALTKGLRLNATNFQLQRTQVALMLARHQYSQAKQRAAALNQHTPDDVLTYGYLAEAEIALGQYPEAERNAQWMLNMRPNNIPGLLIGATLRTLYGDTQGAVEYLKLAYSETSPTETEELAWIANRIAQVYLESGHNDAANKILAEADRLFPGYPYTMDNRARVDMETSHYGDAVLLWKQTAAIDHDPHILYELAKALDSAGNLVEARATYAQFEKLARDKSEATDASELDLILMYAGNTADASKALELAKERIAQRHDIQTQDAYAWALQANGRYQEADTAIQSAIAVGVQDGQIFDHAAHIAQECDHPADSAKYFSLAIQSNPFSEFAADARRSMSSANALPSAQTLISPSAEITSTPESGPGATAAGNPADAQPPVNPAHLSAPPAFAPVPESLLVPQPTETERLIRNTQAAVARSPADPKSYASLGAAYFQRARETGNVSDYELAEQSLAKALDLAPADFSADAALETMAEVCMGEHRFADALNYAQKALALGSGDLSPFAIVGDAYADMGEYDKAKDAYDRLTPPGLALSPRATYARDSRLAYLRFISGDTVGAINLMKTAVSEGTEAHLPSENLAWLYYELGEFLSQAGDTAAADSSYLAALNAHPGDYRALASLARLRANNGQYAGAIELYQGAIAIVPMPIFVTELGDLYAKTGDQSEAEKQYALVEYIGLLGHINQVLHNRDLALFYADHDTKLADALDLAQKELEVRHDVYTWDALAWALYKNGKIAAAREASAQALRYGTRDSLLLFHAGVINEASGHRDEARGYLTQALAVNAHFHLTYASQAQKLLSELNTEPTPQEGAN
jgi:tetratricopeptide (TPR) repeat protein